LREVEVASLAQGENKIILGQIIEKIASAALLFFYFRMRGWHLAAVPF